MLLIKNFIKAWKYYPKYKSTMYEIGVKANTRLKYSFLYAKKKTQCDRSYMIWKSLSEKEQESIHNEFEKNIWSD